MRQPSSRSVLLIILMNTNGQQLNSEAIARYLTAMAANQRKLEYCREILSANPAFVPRAYFKQAETANGQVSPYSFRKLLENHNRVYQEQQAGLIFSYLCVDEKSYVTFDQFYAAIIPKNNPSISKIMEKRQEDSYSLDYSLQFALGKFYSQVYEAQSQLQTKRMFQIKIAGANHSLKNTRLSMSDLEQYLVDHSKFPTQPILKLLHAELNVNKGRTKRNLSIRIYIRQYLESKRSGKGQLPPVQIVPPLQGQTKSVIPGPSKQCDNSSSGGAQKKTIKSSDKRFHTKQNTPFLSTKFCPPESSLTDVEERIQSLLRVVEIKPNIPIIHWGKYSTRQQRRITPLQLNQSIQKIEGKNKKVSRNEQVQMQSEIPDESLRYSSFQMGQSAKKEWTIQQGNEKGLTEREGSFSERQELRKRFKLTQQPVHTPYRELQDCSTPTTDNKCRAERRGGVKRSEATSVEKTPHRRAFNYSQEKGVSGDSISRYKRYSYLKDSSSSLANRISYLKELVTSPTRRENLTHPAAPSRGRPHNLEAASSVVPPIQSQ